jgi:DNA-binding CsgD family transcriptional regulator
VFDPDGRLALHLVVHHPVPEFGDMASLGEPTAGKFASMLGASLGHLGNALDGAAPRTDPRRAAEEEQLRTLTGREREVLELLLCGESARRIAHALSISANTTKHHIRAIYRKLGTSSRAELLARFLEQQLPPARRPRGASTRERSTER